MNIPYVLKETKAPPLCIFLPFGGVDKEHSWLLKSLTATCLRSMTILEAKCSFLIASSLLTAFFFLAHPRSPPLLTLSKCISLSMSLSLPLSQFFLSPSLFPLSCLFLRSHLRSIFSESVLSFPFGPPRPSSIVAQLKCRASLST